MFRQLAAQRGYRFPDPAGDRFVSGILCHCFRNRRHRRGPALLVGWNAAGGCWFSRKVAA